MIHEKLNDFIARPGMFPAAQSLERAISFVSGLNYASDGMLLSGFQAWLVQNYFTEPQSFAWELLVERIEEVVSVEHPRNVDVFLSILTRFIAESD